MKTATLLAACTLAFVCAGNARAEMPEPSVREVTLTLKDHKFEPATVEAKANEKLILTVVNTDAKAEEFESHDLKREKIVAAGSTVKINVGPLKPGTYKFFGEYHEATAKGEIIVKE
jgi:plastocyanin